MYFQKLEDLSQAKEYTSLYVTINALDSWLATLPSTYRNKIIPELFSRSEEVSYDTSYKLFNKLAKINLFKERYMILCPECRHVIYIADEFSEVIDYINEYNNDERICDCCECDRKLNTDNVSVLYKLIDKPRVDVDEKKKLMYGIGEEISGTRLSQKILENPEEYVSKVDSQSMFKASSEEVKKVLKYILSE